MEQYTIRRDDGRNLRFKGVCLATVANSADRAMGSGWSGQTGRSQELSVYRTAAGKYVCERISYTQWQGEHTGYEAEVCEGEADVVDFFGHDRLAKRLYREAEIDAVEEVE